jgi:hypothetical protein
MNDDYLELDKLSEQDRLDLIGATTDRLDASAQAIEKDIWVCRTIDALFTGLGQRPKLFFKGGTSLSKGYGLIKRFSEDVDIVVSRPGLGVRLDEDPLSKVSRKQRDEAANRACEKCSNYVLTRMKPKLATLLPMCTLEEETDDEERMSLRVKYPSIMKANTYLKPWVKIECGPRGANEPTVRRAIAPYIQTELGNRLSLATQGVTLISAERTFWEKALILHGVYCGYRDEKRKPGDKNLISRHYYDVAMIGAAKEGRAAIKNVALLTQVREHKLALFRRRWEKLEEAQPGTLHLVPQPEILVDIKADYGEMSGMMFGEQPSFESIIESLQKIETDFNQRAKVDLEVAAKQAA